MPKVMERTRAGEIRKLLIKRPELTAAQAVEALSKKGIDINPANYYDTKSRMHLNGKAKVVEEEEVEVEADVLPKKKRRKKRRFVHHMHSNRKESVPSMDVELEILRRENQKLRAVVATMLTH